MRQSGGLLEISGVARAIGVSRPTVETHIQALEATHALTIVRPFHGGGQGELVKMPKAYAFDTGFVSYCRGWDPLRPSDCGNLWEHVVLEYLLAHGHEWRVQFWRDTAGNELDFVIARSRDAVDVIECKWDPGQFDAKALAIFRSRYPHGRNFLVCPLNSDGYVKTYSNLEAYVCGPDGWLKRAAKTK
jgi:predicted AAA+ superfamily ATPase